VFGIIQTIPSPTITELALLSGYDFVILDCEHAIVDESSQLASLQIMSASEAFSAVRVRTGDYAAVSRYLDLGADCILMPDLKTATAAKAFVAASLTGWQGTRSSSSSTRSNHYGTLTTAPEPPVLIAMIESADALQHLPAIASTPGIDGLLIGPNDLSADLRIPGDFNNPIFTRAVAAVAKAAADAHLILGGGVYPGAVVQRLLDTGHTFILNGSDVAALRNTFRAAVQQTHEFVKHSTQM
jgi:2-keto-3-deoxy-L-rhamnonate aldolase RhmA